MSKLIPGINPKGKSHSLNVDLYRLIFTSYFSTRKSSPDRSRPPLFCCREPGITVPRTIPWSTWRARIYGEVRLVTKFSGPASWCLEEYHVCRSSWISQCRRWLDKTYTATWWNGPNSLISYHPSLYPSLFVYFCSITIDLSFVINSGFFLFDLPQWAETFFWIEKFRWISYTLCACIVWILGVLLVQCRI